MGERKGQEWETEGKEEEGRDKISNTHLAAMWIGPGPGGKPVRDREGEGETDATSVRGDVNAPVVELLLPPTGGPSLSCCSEGAG